MLLELELSLVEGVEEELELADCPNPQSDREVRIRIIQLTQTEGVWEEAAGVVLEPPEVSSFWAPVAEMRESTLDWVVQVTV